MGHLLRIRITVFITLALAASLALSAPEPGPGGTAPTTEHDGDNYAQLATYDNELILVVLAQPQLDVRAVATSREQGVASLVFWMRAGLPPSAYADVNPYAAKTKGLQALKARILAASVELTPAAVMREALDVTGGQYSSALLTAANLFKEAAGNGHVSMLSASSAGDSQLADLTTKLVDLRASPTPAADKLTPWVDYFGALFVGATVGESQLESWLKTVPPGATGDARLSLWQSAALDTLSVLSPALRNSKQPRPVAGLVGVENDPLYPIGKLITNLGKFLKSDGKAQPAPPESTVNCQGKGRLDVEVSSNCQGSRPLWLDPVVRITGESRCGSQLRKVAFDPLHETEVPSGRYHIKVDAGSFGGHEEDIDIQPGETLKKTLQLCAQGSPAQRKAEMPVTRAVPQKPALIALASHQMEMRAGESYLIPVKAFDENGWKTGSNEAVIRSDNPQTVQVNADGTVTARTVGEARLKIGLPNQKPLEIAVKVLAQQLFGCRIDTPAKPVRVGDIVQLQGQGLLSNGTTAADATLQWRSANEALVTVLDGKAGRIQARKAGTVEIQAEASMVSSKATCSAMLTIEPNLPGQHPAPAVKPAVRSPPPAEARRQKMASEQPRLTGEWKCLASSPGGKKREELVTIAPSGSGYALVLSDGFKTQSKTTADGRYEFTFRSHNAMVYLTLTPGIDGPEGDERLQNDDSSEENLSLNCHPYR